MNLHFTNRETEAWRSGSLICLRDIDMPGDRRGELTGEKTCWPRHTASCFPNPHLLWALASPTVKPGGSVQFSSVAQSCPTLYDPMDCSRLGFPVHCQLLEFTQTHVHRVGNGDLGSIPGLGRSPGGGDSNPRQYSSLENPHRQRSLVGSSPWGRKEDMTKQLSTAQRKHCTL